jgi:hypothetical protein
MVGVFNEMKKHIEDDIQMGIFAWAYFNEKQWPCLRWMHHVRNGGKLGGKNKMDRMIEGARWKRLGVKPGVVDIFLPEPSAGFSGLVIEVKAPGGRLTKEQIGYMDYSAGIGRMVSTVYSIDEAVKVITDYLGVR